MEAIRFSWKPFPEEHISCDMVKHELRVTSCKLRVESLKARVEIQKCDFKSTSPNPQVQIHELRVKLYELRV